MANSVYGKLSKKAKEELLTLVKEKQAGFDMIVANYLGNKDFNALDITSRLQLQYFITNPKLNDLQTNGINGWWQNESYEPNEVAEGLEPVVDTTNNDGDGERLFSSYALKQIPGKFSLSYPLDDNYTEPVPPFKGVQMAEGVYQKILNNLEKNLGVKVVDGKLSCLNLYKRNLVSLAVTKIKNVAFRLVKQLDKVKTSFKGKLVLAEKSANNYTYSNIEKVVKIHDELFRVAIAKNVKDIKKQNKEKINKEIKYASRLFADILMARATDYGNPELNKKVERCLFLQFSNALNRANFTSQQLKLITELGASVVCDTCKQNKMAKEDVMRLMMQNGFEYTALPKNMKEAFLFAKEKDYSLYMGKQSVNNKKGKVSTKKKINKVYTPNFILVSDKDVLNDTNDLPELPEEVEFPELPEPQKFPQIEAPAEQPKLAHVPPKPLLTAKTENNVDKVETTDNTDTIEEKDPKLNVKVIEKIIDKNIVKLLSDKAVSVVRHLDAHDYATVGGKECGEKTATLLANVLTYYQNKTTSKRKDIEKDDSDYKVVRKITNQLIASKNSLIDFFIERGELKWNKAEKYETFLNKTFREITKNEEHKDGITLRAFLKTGIDLIINKYMDDDIKGNNK